MFISEFDEDQMLELQEIEEYPGLISGTGENNCVLHGFEVDLDGNVIIPTLGPQQNDGDVEDYSNC